MRMIIAGTKESGQTFIDVDKIVAIRDEPEGGCTIYTEGGAQFKSPDHAHIIAKAICQTADNKTDKIKP